MTHSQALELVTECVKKEIQSISVDANLHDIYKVDNPYSLRMSERRKKLLAALRILSGPQQMGF